MPGFRVGRPMASRSSIDSGMKRGSSPANGPTPGRAAGLRIFNVSDGAVRTLTTGYDNFPSWSPKGRIVFSRFVNDEFHIFAINPDGTSLTQLTKGPFDDSHPAWAPDGEHVLFSSSRFGFKDEAPMCRYPTALRRAVHHEARRLRSTAADRQPLGGRHARMAARPKPGAATK